MQIPLRQFLVLVILGACAAGCGNPPGAIPTRGTLTLTGPSMGTQYTVKLAGVPENPTEAELRAGIERVLGRIDESMSTWKETSELSRFNDAASTDWFDVSPATAEVVAEAVRIHRESGGVFDVTVNPLLKLWGFGPYEQPDRVPTAAEVEAVRADVGSDKIEVRRRPPALKKSRPQVQIDLSGIAKGYAVDRVAAWLDERGVAAYLVEIGGEVSARGRRPDGRRWNIGIEKPTPSGRSVQKVIELSNRSLATSGDYRNFYERAGRRYSHTIDPRTGRPVEHQLAAVSVIADSCMTADALATALMVLGPAEGYNLAVEKNWAAYLLIHDGDAFVEKATPRFRELTESLRDGT